ncbi:MAG: hypothetical protein RLZZ78_313, partial [Armatimonadota bacterium]
SSASKAVLGKLSRQIRSVRNVPMDAT